MTMNDFSEYAQAMRQLKARAKLDLMDSLQYPHIQEKSRKKRHRDVYKAAYPDAFKQRIVKTTDLGNI